MSKRLFDIAAALAGLLLLAPLLALVALWIKADSPGPVFFRQQRVGRHGQLFSIYKFRTMTAAAAPTIELTVGSDRRITGAGQFLRHYKLDELPQLINVLQGAMSLVGPRPEVPRYVACYPPELRAIVLSVAPGITDWASILYREESAILGRAADPERAYRETILPAKLDYYVRYVRERSFWTDLRIIFSTLAAIGR
jgi:lipopolysaccharide/colanic/teichoic acid biosynthesis glycosyltransferase